MQDYSRAEIDSIVLRSVTKDYFPHAVLTSKEKEYTVMEAEVTAEDLVGYTELMSIICPSDLYMAVIGPVADDPVFISFRYGDIETMTEEQFDKDQEVFRFNLKPYLLPDGEDQIDSVDSEEDSDDWI